MQSQDEQQQRRRQSRSIGGHQDIITSQSTFVARHLVPRYNLAYAKSRTAEPMRLVNSAHYSKCFSTLSSVAILAFQGLSQLMAEFGRSPARPYFPLQRTAGAAPHKEKSRNLPLERYCSDSPAKSL